MMEMLTLIITYILKILWELMKVTVQKMDIYTHVAPNQDREK